MDRENEEKAEGLSLRFALLLALGLLATVIVLNLLGSPEVPTTAEQFQRLMKERAVATVKIAPGGWHAELKRPSRIDNGGGEFITRQVVVPGQGEPDASTMAEWRKAGLQVEYIAEPAPQAGWVGGLLVSGLLGLGLWHLWQQMQRHRREGSPRQHLETLEKEFKAGRVSQEDFDRRAEALMAEM